MDERIVVALIAAGVSMLVGIVTVLATRAGVIRQLRQAQLGQILQKRIEVYPILWSINIRYLTNWKLDKKLQDREWAENYLRELNAFNIDNGLFFSQKLYGKFVKLREYLTAAVEKTPAGGEVLKKQTSLIWEEVYGKKNKPPKKPTPGLSTFLKDDLGSYSGASLQVRK